MSSSRFIVTVTPPPTSLKAVTQMHPSPNSIFTAATSAAARFFAPLTSLHTWAKHLSLVEQSRMRRGGFLFAATALGVD
ncbi:hypothetical protein SNOG_12474 [Parastagonospora nodorum SN15]|uniref:Uncharacterized protein n=1 Tax=Phaeosphaeria nodorum (strain SN15 / ATCC MYA-4574 / FGSC 10173) TaxID=321614 RepID=Q0U6Z0_PHANO|nr:hypothetical protein SNOG_12474 [Parastagonospora nodorum SN15]EAT80287.1 hypothetical protein SNOG_12474 [Parastagonospora nodorum SN15]